jgi:RAQPRD family integrative conjugative element protein
MTRGVTIGAMELFSITPYRDCRAICLAIVLVFVASEVSADAHSERDALARVVNELDALKPLIDAAEAEANSDARVRFRYDWLRADLRQVESGIQDHVDAPRVEPRAFPPLRGDYRQ